MPFQRGVDGGGGREVVAVEPDDELAFGDGRRDVDLEAVGGRLCLWRVANPPPLSSTGISPVARLYLHLRLSKGTPLRIA